MAVYIELTTDPFDAKFADKKQYATSAGAGLVSVRRPTRGLEIKDDTHAYIKLIRVDGVEIPMFDSSAENGMSTANSNFILQSVQEQRMEKHQIVETFGDTYLFLFGEAPRFLQIQATLINSLDFNWKAEFMANYETYLRGTKSVEMGARTYLFYDQNIVEGYILNCSIGESSDQPHLVPLSFQFFVTNAQNISLIGTGSENYPIRSSALVPDGVELTDTLGSEAMDALLSAQTNNRESALQKYQLRDSPVRSFILNNRDEYTTPLQPTLLDLADEIRIRAEQQYREQQEAVDNLESALADILDAYGTEDSDDPFLMDDLGVGPTFLPAGIGVGLASGQAGASATFGASASASVFAGGGVGIGAQVGAGVFAGATAGVSVGSGFGLSSGVSSSVGGSTTARAGASFTADTGVSARASAFANASVQSRVGGSSFATANARAAASAGGYASAGASLSFSGQSRAIGASYAGARSSAGASVFVGGTPTAFAFVAAKGSLTNTGLPPTAAVASLQRSHSFSQSWSWPNGAI